MNGAVMRNPSFGVTDGTNIYFIDDKKVREMDMAHQQIVSIAGADGTTDVKDDVGQNAHFANPNAIAFDGVNLYVADCSDPNSDACLIRKVELATQKVTTIVGVDRMSGEVDGVGKSALVAVRGMTSDGHALYLTSPGPGFSTLPNTIGPTIREVELSTNRVTTMVGKRAVWTARPGVGAQAAVNRPETLAFDAASHSLFVVDYEENVVYRIK
jgi:hypothetical protein